MWEADPSQLAAGLGTRYEIEHTNIKKYAVGSPAQAAVQAAEDLVALDGVAAELVSRVEISLPADLAWVVDGSDMPDVNAPYLVAATLVDQGFSFAMAHDRGRLTQPEVVRIVAVSTVLADEQLRGTRSGRVTLELADGRTLTRSVTAVRGTVDNPMSEDEIVAKSMDLLEPALGRNRLSSTRCSTWRPWPTSEVTRLLA